MSDAVERGCPNPARDGTGRGPAAVLGTGHHFGSGDGDRCARLVKAALAAGVRCFDTADSYGGGAAETHLGETLRDMPRRTFRICGKTGFRGGPVRPEGGLAPDRLEAACRASLKRLGMAFLDVYLCHCADRRTPLRETLAGMKSLMDAGWIRAWGFCDWSEDRIEEALRLCRTNGWPPPTVAQCELNLLTPTPARAKFIRLRGRGLRTMAHSPFAQGVLLGRYVLGQRLRSDSKRSPRAIERHLRRRRGDFPAAFLQLARRLNLDPSSVAWAWTAGRPGVDEIVFGASRPEQILHLAGHNGQPLPAEAAEQLDRLERRFPFRERS